MRRCAARNTPAGYAEMAIGAIIGIISSVIQAVRTFSPPEPPQMADKLFSQIDAKGQGAIESADLQSAFDRIRAAGAGDSADRLFAKLDSDGDGRITRSEFSVSINRLAEQLDQHFMHMRMRGEAGTPPAAGNAGFSREDLSGMVSNLAANFDKADADGDGRVSLKEARALAQSDGVAAAAPDSRNVEMMLMVVRLMQAYGIVGATTGAAGSGGEATQKVSDKA